MSENYQVHGISGAVNNIFNVNFCQTDRNWRKQLLLTNDKFQKDDSYAFDECNNAFTKPKPPSFLNILDNLHKRSDYE